MFKKLARVLMRKSSCDEKDTEFKGWSDHSYCIFPLKRQGLTISSAIHEFSHFGWVKFIIVRFRFGQRES